MYAPEESDRAILSMNQTNKEERSSAEPGERRVRAKENIVRSNTSPTQSGDSVFHGLNGVREAAPLAKPPRWEPYVKCRSYGSVRGAISDGRPYRDT
jgi:hypothetical protein